jgi:hypothetical protein
MKTREGEVSVQDSIHQGDVWSKDTIRSNDGRLSSVALVVLYMACQPRINERECGEGKLDAVTGLIRERGLVKARAAVDGCGLEIITKTR